MDDFANSNSGVSLTSAGVCIALMDDSDKGFLERFGKSEIGVTPSG
jgi:hypothetical protein